MLPSITSQWMILRWHDFVSFRCFNHFNRHKMTPRNCFPGNKTVFTGLAFPFPLIFPLALKTPPLAEHPPKTLPLPRQEKCSDDKHLNWDEIMMSSISRSYGPWGESFSSTWNSLEGQRVKPSWCTNACEYPSNDISTSEITNESMCMCRILYVQYRQELKLFFPAFFTQNSPVYTKLLANLRIRG